MCPHNTQTVAARFIARVGNEPQILRDKSHRYVMVQSALQHNNLTSLNPSPCPIFNLTHY
ncbi:hypothetical protein [Pantoea sp. At-9b]|uniref:hypothetical protein n=1 Tax=Pantoea sp. (strain At-9b) TaxID=592316 RepID=UPI0001B40D49|nr:hypothetical protein [Pantoea sp. At-9b]ADU68896.1 hypothetical protein Pat9b_1579 [Pantoea sp. At-9b]